MESGDIGFGHTGTSNNRFRSHFAYVLATANTRDSVNMVESVMQVYFLDA